MSSTVALAEVWEWQVRGSCRGMKLALFFHPDGERGANRIRREKRAKAICSTCPVLNQCREFAIAAEEPYGVWGGLSESERRTEAHRARRRRRKSSELRGSAPPQPDRPSVVDRSHLRR